MIVSKINGMIRVNGVVVSRYELDQMLDILLEYEDKYESTNDIPEIVNFILDDINGEGFDEEDVIDLSEVINEEVKLDNYIDELHEYVDTLQEMSQFKLD